MAGRTKPGLRGAVVLVLGALVTASLAAAAPPVGSVRVLTPPVTVERSGQQIPLTLGDPVHVGDILRTGAGARLGVIFRDDTRLSMGEHSELAVDRFVFAPAEGRLGMALRLLRGMAAYISGQIARLAPDAVRFETPVATVGIRGTRFVAEVEDVP